MNREQGLEAEARRITDSVNAKINDACKDQSRFEFGPIADHIAETEMREHPRWSWKLLTPIHGISRIVLMQYDPFLEIEEPRPAGYYRDW